MKSLQPARAFILSSILITAHASWSAPGFTIEQIMSAPFATDLVAAPRGAQAVWLENEEGRRNIWFASAPDWHSRKLTSFNEDDGQEIAELTWAPDCSYLLFTRGGDLENGGENPNPGVDPKKPEQAIWRINIQGGPPAKLTVGHSPTISPGGQTIVFIRQGQIYSLASGSKDAVELVEQKGSQSDVQWAPDGSSIAFVSDRGTHSFVGLYTIAEKRLRYLDASVDRDSAPVWSPDSSRLAFLRVPVAGRPAFFSPDREGQPWSIRLANVRSGSVREVFRANPGPGSVFHEIVGRHQIFWAAGDRLVFPSERSGWLHLYFLPIEGGDPTELTPGQGEVEHVALSMDRKTIYLSSNIGDIDRRHIQTVAVGSGRITKSVSSDEEIEWQPEPLAEGNGFVYLTSSYDQHAHPAVRLAGNDVRRLGPVETVLSMVKPQPVLINSTDGMQIHGQLFLPSGSARARHPALIFFHGGSRRQMLLGFHYMYYYSNAYALNQYLASQGYVVLAVNYRSGIGYGLNFREAIHYGAQGGSEFNDVTGAGLFLKSRADVDGSRIGVWGGSYGGYLTAMALSRASDLFAAGVDFHGVHDWSSLRGYLTRGELSGDPNDLKERQEAARIAFESSPMASVDTWRSPVLLIHGDDDRNVEFSQTSMLVEALRHRNVPFEQLIFPNEIHDFLLHRHWVEAYKATAGFFGRKLQP